MAPRRQPSSHSPLTVSALPGLRIRLSSDFDAAGAAVEMLERGVTLVDDIAGQLYDICLDELMDALSHAADEMDIHCARVDTGFGPVFIFRDRARVTLAQAKKLVFAEYPPAA